MKLDNTTIVVIIAIIIFVCWCMSNEKFEEEPKFPPKNTVMLKKQYVLNEEERSQHENNLLSESPAERNISDWTHRGEHGRRNTGFSPRYHDQRTVQYLPSLPNVTDNNEVIKEISSDLLVHEDDYPVFETSDKVDIDNIYF